MSDEGRLVAGRYRLERRIGSGAMGVVWQALDERLNRTVAVKKLLLPPGLPPDEADEAVARCLREGRIAARLHHPNAIAVFDVVDEDGVPCLIMEYLPSDSLAQVLNEQGALAPTEVARIGAQVAAALAAAHAAGIVHRDIKPGNILLGDDGSVKITDFGISRATDDVTVTKTGLIAGTPAYLSPEVAVGREPSAASDVFSLGSTLYAAVEGEPPFGLSENTLGLLHAVASGKINVPEQAGPLTDVLVALLATATADRPSAAKARDLLAAVARGEDPAVPLPAPAPVPAAQDEATRLVGAADATSVVRRPATVATAPPPAKSHRPLVFASAGVAAILGVGAWLLFTTTGGSGGNQGTTPNVKDVPAVSSTTTAPPTTTLTTTRAPAPPPTTTVAPTTTTTTERPTTTTTTTTTEPPTTTTTTTTTEQPTTTTTTTSPAAAVN
ncbi:serine/threonine-protein kinase [Actinokineospora bangkokensis]|uniref:non-specific serine/threonine protein kinase n=1 Tax=Actinokineospora bangkokensis TaxID=1193682 RepID=A0A1Q9LEV7_9PSEU|nr:serine/threonine-protein kinase [Actinokineospora bangkokensis]OLR90558.1 serine/threonine protein kinase [Actinokineospora bangkokensis]